MYIPEPADDNQKYDIVSPNLGYRITVEIHPPTDERLALGLHFFDLNQLFPLLPFIEQSALRFARGDVEKAQEFVRYALDWEDGKSQSRDETDAGMRVLDAAYEDRMRAARNWQRKTLMPLVKSGALTAGIREAISTAVFNFERIQCEELAAQVGQPLNITLRTPEGAYTTKKVRGRRVSVFKSNLGRTKGSKNAKPKVTYEKIVREIKRFKGNVYGHVPTRKQIAKKIGCDETTVKNCLRNKGERRRFNAFARALLEEE